jgi:hypothetical protein
MLALMDITVATPRLLPHTAIRGEIRGADKPEELPPMTAKGRPVPWLAVPIGATKDARSWRNALARGSHGSIEEVVNRIVGNLQPDDAKAEKPSALKLVKMYLALSDSDKPIKWEGEEAADEKEDDLIREHTYVPDPKKSKEEKIYQTPEEFIRSMKIGSHLTKKEVSELAAITWKFREVARKPTPGCVKGYEHGIDLKHGDPIVARGKRKFEGKKKEYLDKMIPQLVAEGWIEECVSQYAAAVHVVPKKGEDGLRIVTDFRDLNEATPRDEYPTANMQQCMRMRRLRSSQR